MPEPFKNRFNRDLIEKLASILHKNSMIINQKLTNETNHEFDTKGFIAQASGGIESLELKARSNQICEALHVYLPNNFVLAADIIESSLAPPSIDETIFHDFKDLSLAGWVLSPICDYIAEKGLEEQAVYYERALALLHACTQRFTAEFAVRPFLQIHPQRTLAIMQAWTADKNQHVRRLVSEGTRPYLPWGIRLKEFVRNPAPVIALLEKLKNDDAEYVRRSVANNLNDIAKDHPDLVAELAEKWLKQSRSFTDTVQQKNTFRMVKHACRTLIKNGHPQVLALFGFPPAQLGRCELSLQSDKIDRGTQLTFSLHIEGSVQALEAQSLLIDYVIHHQKANGRLSPKVFKWKTATVESQQQLVINKHHSFKPVTTRKYYKGEHKIEVLVNGKVFASQRFDLV